MRIVGIDPGTATTGWGIVDHTHQAVTLVDYGIIATSPTKSLSERLETIFTDLSKLIEKYKPERFAVEQVYFNTNAKTALLVGHARGVILLCAQRHKLEVTTYTPLQVKLATTGYGKADKKQIQSMVQRLLKLKVLPKPDDAADALAVAITECHTLRMK
ncbi:crossover junction endodeoxyribonuclease RuvC [Candidatus Gottesmanbacteria bacterium]|nr:crossover junction endodeoxyribonuclease RuvC [Candidatus Gottesmanbacteria bacterium]